MNKVLVIDDETAILKLLESFLVNQNWQVITAGFSAEGIEQFHAERNSVECAIVDQTLPDEEGIQTVAKLREINPELAVVIISGAEDSRIIDSIERDPNTEYLTKPFQMEEMLNTLNGLLDK